MVKRDAVKTVTVDGWSQTTDDVTIVLHAGRKLKQNDISVEFNDDDVKVGLTGSPVYSLSAAGGPDNFMGSERRMVAWCVAASRLDNFVWTLLSDY